MLIGNTLLLQPEASESSSSGSRTGWTRTRARSRAIRVVRTGFIGSRLWFRFRLWKGISATCAGHARRSPAVRRTGCGAFRLVPLLKFRKRIVGSSHIRRTVCARPGSFECSVAPLSGRRSTVFAGWRQRQNEILKLSGIRCGARRYTVSTRPIVVHKHSAND